MENNESNEEQDKPNRILRVNDNFTFSVSLLVLRAFAFEDDSVYYIVGQRQGDTPVGYEGGVMWGVLRNDGTFDKVPQNVMERAKLLVQNENLLKKLE